ncbi:MAG: hypothetical protein RLY14_535 [Planctomycetota bacterium]|jgi:hypothetical protein
MPIPSASSSSARALNDTELSLDGRNDQRGDKATLSDWLHLELSKTIRQIQWVEATSNLAWFWCTLIAVLATAVLMDHWIWSLSTWARYLFWAIWVGLSLYWIGRRVLPLFIYKIHPLYAAKAVEQALPELKNRLISWWELKNQSNSAPRGVVAAVGRQAVAQLRTHDTSALIDSRPMLTSIAIAIALSVLLGLYSISAPRSAWTTAERVLFPWRDIRPPARVQIESVLPGSASVPQSLPCPLEIKVRGLRKDEKIFARFTSADKQIIDRRVELLPSTDSLTYHGLLTTDGKGLQQDVEYWIEAGDALSGPHNLHTVPLPQLTLDRVKLEFPKYTKLPPLEQIADGNIEAVEGTKVTLKATSRGNANKAIVEFQNGSAENSSRKVIRSLSLQLSEQTGSTEWDLRLNGSKENPTLETYCLKAFDASGNTSPDPISYNLRVQADFAPEIQLLATGGQSSLKSSPRGSVALSINALDPDFGLAEVSLEVSKGSLPIEDLKLLEDKEGVRNPWSQRFQLKLSRWRLQPGDKVLLTAVAKDNRCAIGTEKPEPNVSRSSTIEIEIIDTPDNLDPDKSNPADDNDNPITEDPQQGDSKEDGNKDKDRSGSKSESRNDQDNQDSSKESMNDSDNNNSGSNSSNPQDNDSKSSDKNDSEGDGNSGSSNNSGSKSSENKSNPAENNSSSSNKEVTSDDESMADNKSTPNDSSTGDSKNQKPQNQKSQPGKNNSGKNNEDNNAENSNNDSMDNSADPATDRSGNRRENPSQNKANNNPASQPPSDQSPSTPPEHDGDVIERIQKMMRDREPQNGNNQPNKPQQNQDNSSNTPEASKQPNAQPNQNGKRDASKDANPSENNNPSQKQDSENSTSSDNKTEKSPQDDKQAMNPGDSPKSDDPSANKNDPSKNDPSKKDQSQSNDPKENGESSKNSPANESNSKSNQKPNPSQSKDTSAGNKSPEDKSDNMNQSSNESPGEKSDNSSANPDKENGNSTNDSDNKSGEGNKPDGKNSPNNKQGDNKQGNSKSADSKSEKGESNGDGAGDQQNGNGKGDDKQAGSEKSGDKASGNKGNSQDKSGDANKDQTSTDSSQGDDKSGSESESGSEKQNGKPSGKQGSQSAGKEGNSEEGSEMQNDSSKGESGNPSSSKSGEATQGESGKPGDDSAGSSAGKQGGPPLGNGKGSSAGDNSQGENPNEVAEKANLEYAKNATNMALEYLQRQKDQPDPELLKELNWTKEDLNRFLERWQKKRDALEGDQQQRLDAEQDLRSLGLRPPKSKAEAVRGNQDQLRNLQDSGPRVAPPKALKSQFDSLKKLLQQRESSGKK